MSQLKNRLLEDLNSFDIKKSTAIHLFGQNWKNDVLQDLLNIEIAVTSLIASAKTIFKDLDQKSIIITNISTVTLPLLNALTSMGVPTIHVYDKSRSFAFGTYNGYEFHNDFDSIKIEFDLVIDTHEQSMQNFCVNRLKGTPSLISLSNVEVAATYKQMIDLHRIELIKIFRSQIAKNKNFVVFVSKKSYFNQIKMSIALKKKGWDTILMTFDANSATYNLDFFSHVVKSDLLSLIWVTQNINNLILHTQGWLYAYHFPVLLDAFLGTSHRHIIELMDIHSFMFEDKYIQQILPLLNSAYGKFTFEMHNLQLACENYIVHNADGVLFSGDTGHQKHLYKGNNWQSEHRLLNFASYICTDFIDFANEKEFQLNPKKQFVYAGTVIPTTAKHPKELFGEGFMVDITELLIDQGFYFDIFNNPLANDPRYYEFNYPELVKLDHLNHNFNFHAGMPPWQIIHTLNKFQYGILFFRYENIIVGKKQSEHILPTKLFLYLEAGLPVIVSDRLKSICEIVKKHKIGIIVNDNQIEDLYPILKNVDYQKLRENVKLARRSLSMDSNIDRLISLYKSGC